MVTISYSALNDLTREVAEAIERHTGLGVELLNTFVLNDALTSYLDRYGVQYEDELDEGERPEPPEDLADAWRRYQAGEEVTQAELRELDEWRTDVAWDAVWGG